MHFDTSGMKDLKEGVQKLQSNPPNAGACSVMVQK